MRGRGGLELVTALTHVVGGLRGDEKLGTRFDSVKFLMEIEFFLFYEVIGSPVLGF